MPPDEEMGRVDEFLLPNYIRNGISPILNRAFQAITIRNLDFSSLAWTKLGLACIHECNLAFTDSGIGEPGVEDTDSLIHLIFWVLWIFGRLDLLESAGTDGIVDDGNGIVVPSATVHDV